MAARTPVGTTEAPTARREGRATLGRLISGDPDSFARDHWGRRPMLSRAESLPRDFGDLLSPDTVDELLTRRGVRTPFIRMAKEGVLLGRDCFAGSAGFGSEIGDQVDSAKVLAQFADGSTIVLQGLHRLWPPVIDFVRGMVDALGHPVQANAYITPPGSRGFDAHYDVHDVFVLQVSGPKSWTIHEPVHRDPLAGTSWTSHRGAIDDRVCEAPVIDTVLSPGDALYLPRGWIHSARSMGETSIHLTIGVAAVTKYDVLRALVEQLAEIDCLRAPLPIPLDLGDPDATSAVVATTLSEVVDVIRTAPDDLGHRAAARLTNWFADRTRPDPVRPLATTDAIRALDASTPVRWRHGLIAQVNRGSDRVDLRLADRTISFPGCCAPAVDAVYRGALVTADTVPGLDAADGLVLLRRLLREAVVVLADSAPSEHL